MFSRLSWIILWFAWILPSRFQENCWITWIPSWFVWWFLTICWSVSSCLLWKYIESKVIMNCRLQNRMLPSPKSSTILRWILLGFTCKQPQLNWPRYSTLKVTKAVKLVKTLQKCQNHIFQKTASSDLCGHISLGGLYTSLLVLVFHHQKWAKSDIWGRIWGFPVPLNQG